MIASTWLYGEHLIRSPNRAGNGVHGRHWERQPRWPQHFTLELHLIELGRLRAQPTFRSSNFSLQKMKPHTYAKSNRAQYHRAEYQTLLRGLENLHRVPPTLAGSGLAGGQVLRTLAQSRKIGQIHSHRAGRKTSRLAFVKPGCNTVSSDESGWFPRLREVRKARRTRLTIPRLTIPRHEKPGLP